MSFHCRAFRVINCRAERLKSLVSRGKKERRAEQREKQHRTCRQFCASAALWSVSLLMAASGGQSVMASMKVVFPASTNAQSRVEAKVHVRQHSDSE